MENKYSFWREVYQTSKKEIRGQLPIKWDAMRLAIAIIWASLAIGISFVFGVLNSWETAFQILLTLFGAEIFVIVALWVSTPIIAFFKLPWVAEKVGEGKEKEIKEQKDFVEYLKGRERLSRGELIELQEARIGNNLGIEIYDGEEGNPFNCSLYITEISGQGKINPIQITDRGNVHVLPKNSHTVEFIRWKGDDNPPHILNQGSALKFSDSGEYTIKTHLEGSFWSPSATVEKIDSWKLIYKKEEKYLELKKVEAS